MLSHVLILMLFKTIVTVVLLLLHSETFFPKWSQNNLMVAVWSPVGGFQMPSEIVKLLQQFLCHLAYITI